MQERALGGRKSEGELLFGRASCRVQPVLGISLKSHLAARVQGERDHVIPPLFGSTTMARSAGKPGHSSGRRDAHSVVRVRPGGRRRRRCKASSFCLVRWEGKTGRFILGCGRCRAQGRVPPGVAE